MEESGGLWSMGSLRVGHDWTTSLSLFTFMHWRRKWQPIAKNPIQCSCLENPRDRRAWWADVYGVAQSRTRLKRLSSRSIVIWFIIFLIQFFHAFFPSLLDLFCLLGLYHFYPLLCHLWLECSFEVSNFPEEIFTFPLSLFSSIIKHFSLKKGFSSPLAILWISVFNWMYVSLSPLLFTSLHYSTILKASSGNCFAFLPFFFFF